ncbi:MAG: sulfotransferase family protein [Verrucomicrobia bacterium]|nr:MAG: sulfotransferase family protein [Verrucomicrobiota bacterium]
MERASDLAKLPQLDGWLPIRVACNSEPAVVDWCHVGTRRLVEPFFEQTIEQCLREPFNLLFRHQTSLDTLTHWQAVRPGLSPTGFIFHMSRCGSTLLAQMLAALPQNIVVSEAPPLDSLLRAKVRGATEEQKIAWLRGLLSAFGQPRSGDEKQFFVKFDSWHTINLPLIRRAFPDVPWIFIYRDPVEVLTSQFKQRALHLVPGLIDLDLPGLDPTAASQMSADAYCAAVLSQVCAAALNQLRSGGRVVNYRELPDAVWTSLPEYFNLDWTEEDLDRMRHVTQFDAKNPSLFFTANSTGGKEAGSPLIRELSARWIDPVYRELEAQRQKGGQV